MNQMLIILISLLALAITDVEENVEAERGEESFYTSAIVKAAVIKSPDSLSFKYKCLNR
jgi:hypothetical protein